MKRNNYLCTGLIVIASLYTVFAQDKCDNNPFPVYSGGSQNEFVNCFSYDKKN